MMRKFLFLILTVALLLSIMATGLFNITASAATSEFAGGSGTEADPYLVETKVHLNNVRNNLGAHYKLISNIVFSEEDFPEGGTGWNPIGSNETPFTGVFDGNGYGVSGLEISANITDNPYVGLFGYNKGCIKNIISMSGQITITHASNTIYVGMIAGYSEGVIENCKSVGSISVTPTILRATYETPCSYVGGITGYSVGALTLCENTCDIQATPTVIAYAEAVEYLGGIAGLANSSTVSNCINSGSITLTPTLDGETGITVFAGGILGRSNGDTNGCDNSGSVIIEEFESSSTSRVAIDAKFYAAGIIGYSSGTITGSNNTGTIRARGVYAYSGGVAGYNTGTLSQCSNIGNIMAITTSTGSGAYSCGYSGGIAGYSTGTTSESYNTGFVEVSEAGASEAAYSGGIVSYQKGGTIINCYNAGYVPDKTYYGDTGGIAGYSTGSISLCYNIGRVPEGYPSGAGAIVGYTSQITPNCFFLDDNKIGVDSGKDTTIPCSKEALLLAETYTGFDFNSVWEIGIYDTYPCATLKNVEHNSSTIGNDLFAGGTGTAYDPFLIENAEQLNNVRVIPSAYYELIADIAFKDSDYAEGGTFYNDGEGWLPIMYFVGSFDGCGHVISNLQIYHAPTSSVSSYSTSNEKYARSCDDCFGLFGFNCGGTISRVGVTGNIYVERFKNPSTLDYAYVGGIAGMSNGTINECYFIGSVYGTASYSSEEGGICGWSWDPEGTLENCFSKWTFTGPTPNAADRITGSGSYSNCYSIGRFGGDVRGSGNAVYCTEAKMRTQSTYTDFDFNSVWTMAGDVHYLYPELQSVKLDPAIITHTFTNEDTTYLKSEATCTSPAIYYKSCSACGEKGTETFEYGTSLGHVGGTPTCTTKAVCTRCIQSYGDMLDHVYTDEDAIAAYLKTEATCTSKAVYYMNCATCDKAGPATFEYGLTEPHSYTRQATIDTYKKSSATCTEAAVYYYCCATCDAKGTNTYKVGDANGHDYKTIFTWSENHTYCTAAVTCERDCGLYEVVNCTVTHSKPNQAQTAHTAVAEYDGTGFTDILTCDNFLITFKDWDDTKISSTYYHAGDAVTVPTNPTRGADKSYTYTFTGWDKTVVDCVGDATYTATYTPSYIDYTVVFKNWNGDVLSTKTYHYGDKVTAPTNPTKAADKTYTYTFNGWDNAVVNCAGDATYTATYTSRYIDYTVVFKNWDGSVISTKTYHYGDKVSVPADPSKTADKTYTYEFAGWDKTITTVTGDVVYTATYMPSYISYTVVFQNYDGNVLSKQFCHYGDPVSIPGDPTRYTDETYTYAFAGWDSEVTKCYGDKVYTATYTPTYREYIITFINYDDSVISEQTYHYGDTVTLPADPTRASSNTYKYTFQGWNSTVTTCTESKTYTAVYASEYIDYTITFKNYDGTVISSATYHYGDSVIAPTPTGKPADNKYTYNFAGWDAPVVPCNGNKEYTATYTPQYINYTVTFQYEDGTVIKQNTLHYGDSVVAPADPAVPDALGDDYEFAGWDKEITDCQGNTVYAAVFARKYIPGDIDGNEAVTQDDAVYLLLHTMFGETFYPLENAPADIDGNGTVNQEDAVYLLLHTMFGETFYPLNTAALPVRTKE